MYSPLMADASLGLQGHSAYAVALDPIDIIWSVLQELQSQMGSVQQPDLGQMINSFLGTGSTPSASKPQAAIKKSSEKRERRSD